MRLTSPPWKIRARRIIVIEETVQPCAVDDDVLGLDNAEVQGRAFLGGASAVIWVVEGGVC